MSGSPVDVRARLLDSLSAIPENEVAVALSGGVDSRAILYALLELGKTPHAYTFAFADEKRADFYISSAIAKREGVAFTPVFLPRDLNTLRTDVYRLREEFRCAKKTEYECSWPFLYLYPALRENWLATGLGAEGHFVLSKRAILHYKDRPDVFRSEYYSSDNPNQRRQHQILCAKYGKSAVHPFLERKTVEMFMGTTWDEINRPRQKQPILDAFPDKYLGVKVNAANLQIGSGVREHFDRLLKTKMNLRGLETIAGVLNDVNKGVRVGSI